MSIQALIAAVIISAALVTPAIAQAPPSSNPETHLPPNIHRLTYSGERAAWSPDGKRIAYISQQFGEAYEVNLRTHLTRVLTVGFPHVGWLRVQYLPNGDY